MFTNNCDAVTTMHVFSGKATIMYEVVCTRSYYAPILLRLLNYTGVSSLRYRIHLSLCNRCTVAHNHKSKHVYMYVKLVLSLCT